jgi:hypothetical protein
MGLATATCNSILDHITSRAAYTMPTAFFVGLSSTTPTDTGTNVTEPSGWSYARKEILSTDLSAAANKAITNSAEIAFAQATADWVAGANLTHAVFYDAVTAGNFIGWCALGQAKPCLNGDTMKIPVGDLDISLS